MKTKNKLMGHLLAIFTVFVWGTTFVSSKVLLREFSAVELLFDRFVLGYVTLWLMKPRWLKLTEKKQEILFAIAGLSGVCLYYLFENLALTYTQAANVSVVVSISPLFVSILAHFTIKEEKIQKTFFAGFICAIVGIILLSFGGGEKVELSILGDGLCIAAAVTWAIYSITIRKLNRLGYPTILVTRRVFFYGILFMLPIAATFGYQLDLSRFGNVINLGNFLFLGIIACAICFVTWNRAVDILGAIKTSAYIYAIPVVTVVFSIMVLQETITPMMAVGTGLTIVGLILSENVF